MTVREIHEEWDKFYEEHREEFIRGGGSIGIDPASASNNNKGWRFICKSKKMWQLFK